MILSMHKILLSLLASIILVSGCSAVTQQVGTIVSKDLDVAIARGEAALGSNDALVVCYKAVNKVIKAQLEADQIEGGLLLDLAMKARIVEQVRKQVAAELKDACGEIAVEIMLQVATRGR
jgi:hypothetical protein